MSTTEVTAALDIGGTKIATGLVTADGTVLHHTERPTAVEGRLRDPGLHGTVTAARSLLAEAGRRGLTVVALGAGFPEYVAADGRLTSREVLAWDVQPGKLLGAELPGVPVTVGSDVRCGALGEAHHGAGAGREDFLYVSLGTGLSSAYVRHGTPLPGRRGEAIALGEFEVPASVDPGWRGNLEQYCSGRGIGDRRTALGGATTPGAREVIARAAQGDPVADHVLATAGAALGTVLAMAVRLLDPAAIILGGGLGSAPGPVRSALEAAYAERTGARPDAPPLLTAALGPAAGLIGAARLATP
ncbi:ROK family protein [Streptomyces sp. NPDC048290]|uniref:ROK family protein n=1 Tax=Streptomyces sp. NPDC048290 TaxID=3155811 RepID=UPI0034235819